MFVYVEHEKQPSIRFQVLSYDKDSGMAKLKGEYGAEFSQSITKEALARRGYRIRKSETELPLMSAAPAKTVKPKEGKPRKVTTEEEEE